VSRTVDLVVAGSGRSGLHAAIIAARRGGRVLIVLGPDDLASAADVLRSIRSAGAPVRRVRVMTGAEVACVDGVGRVEAVVVRRVGSPDLVAFNAGGFVAATSPDWPT